MPAPKIAAGEVRREPDHLPESFKRLSELVGVERLLSAREIIRGASLLIDGAAAGAVRVVVACCCCCGSAPVVLAHGIEHLPDRARPHQQRLVLRCEREVDAASSDNPHDLVVCQSLRLKERDETLSREWRLCLRSRRAVPAQAQEEDAEDKCGEPLRACKRWVCVVWHVRFYLLKRGRRSLRGEWLRGRIAGSA